MKRWLREIWTSSVSGVRANLLPGLVLQCVALGIVLTYYFVPAARGVFDGIGNLKQAYSYLFSAVSTALFGGLVPFLYLLWTGRIPRGRTASLLVFYLLYWAQRGIEVDLLYRVQTHLFGAGIDFGTIAKKVCVDQFVYNPFWAAYVMAIFYGWKEGPFTWFDLRARFRRRLFTHEAPSMLLATWLVWIPATAIIYSLPAPLQIPLFNLALCFFVLMVTALANGEGGDR